ncbi:hypothetical protein KPL70_026559 [Citrus sinensis]|nr:hypothetical protein KPL70_026559 [Citrus sinensis]
MHNCIYHSPLLKEPCPKPLTCLQKITIKLVIRCLQREKYINDELRGWLHYEYDSKHHQGLGIGFKEDDKPNFACSFYSKTKAMVTFISYLEILILVISIKCLINFQVEGLFKACEINPRHFVTNLACYNKVVNISDSMIVLHEMSPIAIEMARRKCKGQAKVLVAPRSHNDMDVTKLKKEFPEVLSIKGSIIKYMLEPNKKKK